MQFCSPQEAQTLLPSAPSQSALNTIRSPMKVRGLRPEGQGGLASKLNSNVHMVYEFMEIQSKLFPRCA